MHALWVVLMLALGAQATLQFHESWKGAREGKSGRAAWGHRHAWIEVSNAAGAQVLGLPEGVLEVVEGDGSWWAVLENGDLRRVDGGASDCWSLGHRLLATVAEEGRGQWLLGGESLTLVRLRNSGSPEALCRIPIPANPGTQRLKKGRTGSWLQRGNQLYLLRPGQLVPVLDLPESVQDWEPWQGRILELDSGGHLCWQELRPGSAGLAPLDPQAHPLPTAHFDKLLAVPGGLWLHEGAGCWWRWPEDQAQPRAVALTYPEVPDRTWQPASLTVLVAQDAQQRCWWREERDIWTAQRTMRRSPALRDRLVRSGSDWQLALDGQLRQGRAGQWEDRGQFPAARGLWRGGTGPWLQLAQGLRVFSEGGAVIGGWQGSCEGGAAVLEDYFIVGGGDSLRVFWNSEEDPWLQATLPLPAVERVSASPLAAAVLAEAQVHLLDVERPWLPRLEQSSPAPEGLLDLLMVEDRLLLACTGGLQVWKAREGRWEASPGPLDGSEARWLCHRGANRVLALTQDGRLSQWRLLDNQPVEVEWSQRLPLAGAMKVEGDSLRVLGEAGHGDWALPAWNAPPEPKQPEQHRILDPGGAAMALGQLGRTLVITCPNTPLARVRVYNLLGRQVARGDLVHGSARLDLGHLATGRYVVQLGGSQEEARLLSWQAR